MKKPKTYLWQLQNREVKTGICNMCHEQAELTIDHIFPASLLVKWGLQDELYNDKDNFQLICRKCQLLKKDCFDFHNPKTIYLIEKYVKRLKDLYTEQLKK